MVRGGSAGWGERAQGVRGEARDRIGARDQDRRTDRGRHQARGRDPRRPVGVVDERDRGRPAQPAIRREDGECDPGRVGDRIGPGDARGVLGGKRRESEILSRLRLLLLDDDLRGGGCGRLAVVPQRLDQEVGAHRDPAERDHGRGEHRRPPSPIEPHGSNIPPAPRTFSA